MADLASAVGDASRTGHKSARSPVTEVTTCGKRRRHWTAEQKRQIVAESLEPGV